MPRRCVFSVLEKRRLQGRGSRRNSKTKFRENKNVAIEERRFNLRIKVYAGNFDSTCLLVMWNVYAKNVRRKFLLILILIFRTLFSLIFLREILLSFAIIIYFRTCF